jgi:hypothetical protein
MAISCAAAERKISSVLIVGLGLFAGILIGAAGIGGVILVPALVHLAGIPVRTAIAAATMSYIATEVAGSGGAPQSFSCRSSRHSCTPR